MKNIILLLDNGNAEFLVINVNDEYKLPTVEMNNNLSQIGEKISLKYGVDITKDSIEVLLNINNNLLIKAYVDKNNNSYEYKILNDIYDLIKDENQKQLLLDIKNKIFFESINDSFWLGILLTVEDNIENYQMKNILSSFLLQFSLIFCEETVKYKLGEIKEPILTKSNLKKMRNSYLKSCPIYDSKKITKLIDEMGISFEVERFDVILYLINDSLIDINSRTWNLNNSSDFDIYNSIILSPRRWIKNQLPEELNDKFELLRSDYVKNIIEKVNKIEVVSKTYSTKRLLDANLSYNDRVYILQRIGLIKTIKILSNIIEYEDKRILKNNTGFYLDYNLFLIKIKATLIEMLWNDKKSNNIPFLNELFDNLPHELNANFFIINRKCRDNIHYGFYNNITEVEYEILEKEQDIYMDYVLKEFENKIVYIFDKKYEIEVKIANFLYKISKKIQEHN